MKRLEVSGAVRPIYVSLGVKRLIVLSSSNIVSDDERVISVTAWNFFSSSVHLSLLRALI